MNARLRGMAPKMSASDPPAPSSHCSDSDSYTQKCRIEISKSSGCRATVTTRNPWTSSAFAKSGVRRQWSCRTTSGGRPAQSASTIACRARCGTWYAAPSRWRTQVFPARGVLTTAIRSGASKPQPPGRPAGLYLHYSPAPSRRRRSVPRFRPPAAAIVALALAGTSAVAFSVYPEGSHLIPTDLPAADRQLVEFLLLLPVAALVCGILRNLVGLHTYGTFAPALLGLA